MKKFITTLLCILSLMAIVTSRQTVQAAEDIFPYEGIYLTGDNRIFRGFIFEENGIYILLRNENMRNNDTKNMERYFNLLNANTGATGMIDPMMDAEEVEKWREENLNLPNYAEIFAEVTAQITPDMTRQEIDALIDAQDPSIDYSYIQHNFNAPSKYQFVKLNAPTIEKSQDLWIVKINKLKLLRFEYDENVDGSNITDDYGVIYTKQDEIPEYY